MALFVREDRTQKPDAETCTPTPPPQAAAGAREGAHLGRGSRIEGKLAFEGSVQIDGQVDGEISAQDTVTVGEGAEVTAQISANTIIVQGRVAGDLTARKRIEMKGPAVVTGNITTPSLVISEGVVFEGRCTMGGTAPSAKAERTDKRVALFPAEDRGVSGRRSSEAAG